jgi:hypothetical protein
VGTNMYRVTVFNLLTRRSNIELTAGRAEQACTNSECSGVDDKVRLQFLVDSRCLGNTTALTLSSRPKRSVVEGPAVRSAPTQTLNPVNCNGRCGDTYKEQSGYAESSSRSRFCVSTIARNSI